MLTRQRILTFPSPNPNGNIFKKMSDHLAPKDYNLGDKSNYAFAMKITCANDDARKAFIEGYGHMVNYNHEMGIACYC